MKHYPPFFYCSDTYSSSFSAFRAASFFLSFADMLSFPPANKNQRPISYSVHLSKSYSLWFTFHSFLYCVFSFIPRDDFDKLKLKMQQRSCKVTFVRISRYVWTSLLVHCPVDLPVSLNPHQNTHQFDMKINVFDDINLRLESWRGISLLLTLMWWIYFYFQPYVCIWWHIHSIAYSCKREGEGWAHICPQKVTEPIQKIEVIQ